VPDLAAAADRLPPGLIVTIPWHPRADDRRSRVSARALSSRTPSPSSHTPSPTNHIPI